MLDRRVGNGCLTKSNNIPFKAKWKNGDGQGRWGPVWETWPHSAEGIGGFFETLPTPCAEITALIYTAVQRDKINMKHDNKTTNTNETVDLHINGINDIINATLCASMCQHNAWKNALTGTHMLWVLRILRKLVQMKLCHCTRSWFVGANRTSLQEKSGFFSEYHADSYRFSFTKSHHFLHQLLDSPCTGRPNGRSENSSSSSSSTVRKVLCWKTSGIFQDDRRERGSNRPGE